MAKVIVYGFKTWDAASGSFVVSPAKAESTTIEAMGAKAMGDEPEAVDEARLNAERLYFSSDA